MRILRISNSRNMGIKSRNMAKKITPKKKAKPAVKKTGKKVTAIKVTGKPLPKDKKPIVKSKPAAKKKVAKKVIKVTVVKKPTPKKVVAKPKVTPKKVVTKPKIVPKPKVAPKKVVAKPKIVLKPKVAPKKVAAKKINPKKTTVKPKVQPKKIISKTKVQQLKKITKTPLKKVSPKSLPASKQAKHIVAKKAVKKAVPVKAILATKKPQPQKPIVKIDIPSAKETIQKVVQKVVPEPVAQAKILQRPKIVPIRNMPKFEANYNRADMFYKNVLKAEIVKRYSLFNEEHKEFLQKDQSLTIKFADKETTISEKSRDQDWNDIYVEIFRKYPDEAGWIKYTEADYLAYFFPGRVFWAKMEPIKMLCDDILSKAVDSGIYKELYYMFPKNSGRLSKTFKINTKTYSFNFIQTYHEEGDHSYYSIGISLPFVLLMDFRIDYKIFKQ